LVLFAFLDIKFDDWEIVQTALTHYSYVAARKTNDALSRVGEKVLRFVLVTELQHLEPVLSKQQWFLPTNIRFLTRFEFLSSFIDSTLQLAPLTRYKEHSDLAKMRHQVFGREALQFQQSVVAKSILALIGVIYKKKGEAEARNVIRVLFIDPYRDNTGKFLAPVLQPLQIKQTGGL
jgi:dsRNA-specific ribonuclease